MCAARQSRWEGASCAQAYTTQHTRRPAMVLHFSYGQYCTLLCMALARPMHAICLAVPTTRTLTLAAAQRKREPRPSVVATVAIA